MDRRSSSRNQAFLPAQFGAAFYGPNRPAEVQLQHCVQGLRDALCSAITEIKSLKKENKALKEQVGLLGNRQMEVSQLQEELRQKDDLLKRATKKRRARLRAHVETLYLLTQMEMELKRSEEQWKSRCDALEANLISKNNQLQMLTKEQEQSEAKARKEQEEKKMKEEEENEEKRKEEKEKMEKEVKESVKEEGEEKMENRENEKEEKETKRSEEKEMNDKKEKKTKKKREKKKNRDAN